MRKYNFFRILARITAAAFGLAICAAFGPFISASASTAHGISDLYAVSGTEAAAAVGIPNLNAAALSGTYPGITEGSGLSSGEIWMISIAGVVLVSAAVVCGSLLNQGKRYESPLNEQGSRRKCRNAKSSAKRPMTGAFSALAGTFDRLSGQSLPRTQSLEPPPKKDWSLGIPLSDILPLEEDDLWKKRINK